MRDVQVPIRIPRAHAKQEEIKKSTAKRKVVNAGRRAGKTTLASQVATEKALEGKRVLLASPTQEQADAFWTKCKEWFAGAIKDGWVKKNETERSLTLPTGGRIRAKTAWNADTLRGDYADFLVLDEYALMDPDAWDKVGSPMLLDNDGDAWFISTPRRRNHFHALYAKAMGDATGRWQAWHFTSFDNPFLSKTALAEIREDLTEDGYKQEILAEFLENEGQVFRNLDACLVGDRDVPEQHGEFQRQPDGSEVWVPHRIVMGVDWGKQTDFTAISVVCVDCHREVALDRFNQIDYTFQRGRLRSLYDAWHVNRVLAEANAMGDPIIDQLTREGVNVSGFQTTPSSKPPLIESLALALEREEMIWLRDAIGRTELEAYERRLNPQTNRSSYSAPKGVHDDTVMARALAFANSRQSGGVNLVAVI